MSDTGKELVYVPNSCAKKNKHNNAGAQCRAEPESVNGGGPLPVLHKASLYRSCSNHLGFTGLDYIAGKCFEVCETREAFRLKRELRRA